MAGHQVLDAHGRNVAPSIRANRQAAARSAKHCPTCGAGPKARIASGSFGPLSTICGQCGFDFKEPWRDR